jgi:hypothetical protein
MKASILLLIYCSSPKYSQSGTYLSIPGHASPGLQTPKAHVGLMNGDLQRHMLLMNQ